MKIYANQLPAELNKGLANCYLIFGDEPFQVNEARDLIKSKAKQQGIDEFIRLSDDEQFDWEDLQQHCQAMSLFSSTKLIELELSSNKIGKVGSDTLKQIASTLTSDTVLVIFGGKLEAAQTKSAWFKAVSQNGVFIPIYEIDGPHLQRWLKQQLLNRNLNLTPDAQAFLISFTSGNLLACAQELDKLKLSHPNSPTLTLELIQGQVADQSRYTVFQLTDALWENKPDRCLSILGRLKLEEFEPNIILWSLNKDISLILLLQNALKFNESTSAIFDSHRVWKNKQALYTRVAQSINPELLKQAMKQLSELDQALKFHTVDCPYTLFAHICLLVSGYQELATFPLPFEINIA
ncbi:DNA polymerase III subunit delta [Psychrosphaera aestuarii]|uniref:DNA polymerase III subunit delta n=1 Tax=Psychrosphaera aestuarii TaxID=1266052 RepID=UPI001B32DEF5|nr:DNA polymerase III subunit delta [Psychrosphaera aestuarii]